MVRRAGPRRIRRAVEHIRAVGAPRRPADTAHWPRPGHARSDAGLLFLQRVRPGRRVRGVVLTVTCDQRSFALNFFWRNFKLRG